MEVHFQGEQIELDHIVRLYPAAIMTLPDGDTVQVSLQWAETKFDEINVTGFVLVFDFGINAEEEKLKKEFFYDSFVGLESAIKEVALLLPEQK